MLPALEAAELPADAIEVGRIADAWGIKVSSVEVKHVDLPPDMQRAMARQAEAEREKRAKIIHAAGELESSEKLAQAARVIGAEPVAITLRYLSTLTEIAGEQHYMQHSCHVYRAWIRHARGDDVGRRRRRDRAGPRQGDP